MSAQTQAEPMTPEQLLEAHPCRPWCTITPATHLAELTEDDCTFHRGASIDAWTLAYRGKDIRVAVDEYLGTSGDENGEPIVTIDGDMSRGSVDYSELAVADAQRLGLALMRATAVAVMVEAVR